jgi:hypothetical protein
MSRQPNEMVRRRIGSCFLGAEKPDIVRLSGPQDGDLHSIDICMMGCGNPECREWTNVQIVDGPFAGEWLCHLSECQMEDI